MLASPGGKDTAATQAGGEHSPDGEVAPRMTDASPAGRSNPDTSEIRKADEARVRIGCSMVLNILCHDENGTPPVSRKTNRPLFSYNMNPYSAAFVFRPPDGGCW